MSYVREGGESVSDRLTEIQERLARFDAAIPQRDIAECWSKPHFFSECKDCDAHGIACDKFHKAAKELHATAQSDLHWALDELVKERAKVTHLVKGLIGVACWSSKTKPTSYCWHNHRSCQRSDGHSDYETCEQANKAIQEARK